MTDLITRLSAELDRREAIARAATPGAWSVNDPTYPEAILSDDGHVLSGGRWGGEASIFDRDEDAHHIAANNPATALRLIEAHRKILDLYRVIQQVVQAADGQRLWTTTEVVTGSKLIGQHDALREVIRELAEGYGINLEEGT